MQSCPKRKIEKHLVVFYELITKIRKQGKTVLLIEQNASMALSIADRGYVLETGDVTLEGAGKELLSNPEVMKAYLGI